MKTLFYFILLVTFSSLFQACNGDDYENAIDGYCYFQPQMIEYENLLAADDPHSCVGQDILFSFRNKTTGNVTSYIWTVGQTAPIMTLPKPACYELSLGIKADNDCQYTIDMSQREETIEITTKSTLNIGGNFPGFISESTDFCLAEDCSV